MLITPAIIDVATTFIALLVLLLTCGGTSGGIVAEDQATQLTVVHFAHVPLIFVGIFEALCRVPSLIVVIAAFGVGCADAYVVGQRLARVLETNISLTYACDVPIFITDLLFLGTAVAYCIIGLAAISQKSKSWLSV